MGDPNMPLGVRMVNQIKYKIGDKAEFDNVTAEYDMLGQIPDLKIGDGNTYDKNSPLVGKENMCPMESWIIQFQVGMFSRQRM